MTGTTMDEENVQLTDDCPMKIVGVKADGDQVVLKAAMTVGLRARLYRFLEMNGCTYYGRDKATIALLLDYGLSEVTTEELQDNVERMNDQFSAYAAMRFQAYEYYVGNNSITQGLRYFLAKNESLKRRLREKGSGSLVPEDEWDTWDDAAIDAFYHRYIK